MQHKSMLHKTYIPHSFPIKLFHTSLNEDDEKHPLFSHLNSGTRTRLSYKGYLGSSQQLSFDIHN